MAGRLDYGDIVVVSLVITVVSVIANFYFDYNEQQQFSDVKTWLTDNKLNYFADTLQLHGYLSLQNVARMTSANIDALVQKEAWLPSSEVKQLQSGEQKFRTSVLSLNKRLRFDYWLTHNMLDEFRHVFNSNAVYSLEDAIANMKLLKAEPRLDFAFRALVKLSRDKQNIGSYPIGGSTAISSFLYFIWTWIVWLSRLVIFTTVVIAVVVFSFLGFLFNALANAFTRRGRGMSPPRPIFTANFFDSLFNNMFTRLFSRSPSPSTAAFTRQESQTTSPWYNRIIGNYFDAKKSVMTWKSPDNDAVGEEAILLVRFYKNNGAVYKSSLLEALTAEVLSSNNMVDSNIVYETDDENLVSVHFTPIKSGRYDVNIIANGETVCSSKTFKPCSVDPFKSSLLIPSSLMVFEQNVGELLTLDERDKYGNRCTVNIGEFHRYQFVIHECKSGFRVTPEITFNCEESDVTITASMIITDPGVYRLDILYNEDNLSSNVILLVLSSSQMLEVGKNISTTHWNLWYEAYMFTPVSSLSNSSSTGSTSSLNNLEPGGSSSDPMPTPPVSRQDSADYKKKKVFCYISPKFLIIKEYFLKIIPKKLFTFRINPTVKVFLCDDTRNGMDSFTIETSSGKQIKLFCLKRNIVVATYVKLLLKSIGGSECFEDKVNYFYNEVNKLYPLKSSQRMSIKIKRASVVEDTWQAVKSLSPADWWKKFEINFVGEMGLDYGGLSREWIQILVTELFHDNLFRRFDTENLQALCHPTPFREGMYKKLKYFELAGLITGKCLIECSLNKSRQQYIKARFTRSFLSQILGLRVSWKHFETDDKEYYSGKIKYILDNDPECLDIYFTEDIYDNNNQLVKTIELKPNGSKLLVTESNKLDYIQRLAEYRLVECLKDEVGAFLKGLQSLIPDGLLTMFDENELELLLCGMDVISVSDFKANYIKDYSELMFGTVMNWFWTVVSGFSQEELSRLLQFTTGCSQLPPEGFTGLQPAFKISSSGAIDSLPMAHTCFNQLCLPCYSSQRKLKSQLLLAINEGVEGFGFA